MLNRRIGKESVATTHQRKSGALIRRKKYSERWKPVGGAMFPEEKCRLITLLDCLGLRQCMLLSSTYNILDQQNIIQTRE